MSGIKKFLMLLMLTSAALPLYANPNSGRVTIGVSCRVIQTGKIKFCPIAYSENMSIDLKKALENIDIKCPEGTTLSLSYHIEKISSYQNQPFCSTIETKPNDSVIKFYKNSQCSEELQPGEKLKVNFRNKDKKSEQPIYCKFDPETSSKDEESADDENENVILIIELNY